VTPAIGQDIESVCSRCGTSWHVVVAMVEQKPVKVECKQCHSVHRHRLAKSKSPAPKRTSAKKTARGAAARPLVEADLQKPVQTYAIDKSYQPGGRVDHATFGRGVVQSASPGRIEVLFGDQIKVLTQGRSRRSPAPGTE
jgi:hypothetical protein